MLAGAIKSSKHYSAQLFFVMRVPVRFGEKCPGVWIPGGDIGMVRSTVPPVEPTAASDIIAQVLWYCQTKIVITQLRRGREFDILA
jgi:hypothetical protein